MHYGQALPVDGVAHLTVIALWTSWSTTPRISKVAQRPALLEEAEWDRTLDVNLKGAFLGAALHAIPAHSGVAAAVAFLASEEASIITGATLPVDGDLGIQSTAALLKPSLRAGWRQGRLDLVELE